MSEYHCIIEEHNKLIYQLARCLIYARALLEYVIFI